MSEEKRRKKIKEIFEKIKEKYKDCYLEDYIIFVPLKDLNFDCKIKILFNRYNKLYMCSVKNDTELLKEGLITEKQIYHFFKIKNQNSK